MSEEEQHGDGQGTDNGEDDIELVIDAVQRLDFTSSRDRVIPADIDDPATICCHFAGYVYCFQLPLFTVSIVNLHSNDERVREAASRARLVLVDTGQGGGRHATSARRFQGVLHRLENECSGTLGFGLFNAAPRIPLQVNNAHVFAPYNRADTTLRDLAHVLRRLRDGGGGGGGRDDAEWRQQQVAAHTAALANIGAKLPAVLESLQAHAHKRLRMRTGQLAKKAKALESARAKAATTEELLQSDATRTPRRAEQRAGRLQRQRDTVARLAEEAGELAATVADQQLLAEEAVPRWTKTLLAVPCDDVHAVVAHHTEVVASVYEEFRQVVQLQRYKWHEEAVVEACCAQEDSVSDLVFFLRIDGHSMGDIDHWESTARTLIAGAPLPASAVEWLREISGVDEAKFARDVLSRITPGELTLVDTRLLLPYRRAYETLGGDFTPERFVETYNERPHTVAALADIGLTAPPAADGTARTSHVARRVLIHVAV